MVKVLNLTRCHPQTRLRLLLEVCLQYASYHCADLNISLQDHFSCSYTAEMDSQYDSLEVLADPDRAAEEWKL